MMWVVLILSACKSTGEALEVGQLGESTTIKDLHQYYSQGSLTPTDVVKRYLRRIDSLDDSGPMLNAVLTVNPKALEIAAVLDQRLAEGDMAGPLFGVPILLKDNIDTGDGMPCTAGAICMRNNVPTKDSPIVQQLRAAGAIILGKANLSEWANFHSYQSSSGWSALNGQTSNPYDLSRNPCGSSSGSAASVSADLCMIAIGTETNGSIVCPSNNNGIVGVKPTVGLLSRRGIIPISHTQDTPGPMARTVTDAARALGTMVAVDPLDDKTSQRGRIAMRDYTKELDTSIKGMRIGYYTQPLDGDTTMHTSVMDTALEVLRSLGADIVAVDSILPTAVRSHSFNVLLYEFKAGLNDYLRQHNATGSPASLAEVIDVTFADSVEMEYHDHGLLKLAQTKGPLTDKAYHNSRDSLRLLARDQGLDRVLQELNLAAILAPTGSPAWETSLEEGDDFGISSSSPAAMAGYPNVSVPMGQIDGLPVNMSIFAEAWSEQRLLQIAYAYEQASKQRFAPTFRP